MGLLIFKKLARKKLFWIQQPNMNSSCVDKWKPVFAMLGVNLALAVNNVLLKKVLNQGMSYLMIITYRQTISTIFLIPIAYFYERYGFFLYSFLFFFFYASRKGMWFELKGTFTLKITCIIKNLWNTWTKKWNKLK